MTIRNTKKGIFICKIRIHFFQNTVIPSLLYRKSYIVEQVLCFFLISGLLS